MFGDYFGDRYFAPRYFPNLGAAAVVGIPDIVNATVTFRRQVTGTATFTRTVHATMHIRGVVEGEIER